MLIIACAPLAQHSIVCLETFQAGSIVRCLQCHHVFHAECINAWFLRHHTTCPLCMACYISESALPTEPPRVFLCPWPRAVSEQTAPSADRGRGCGCFGATPGKLTGSSGVLHPGGADPTELTGIGELFVRDEHKGNQLAGPNACPSDQLGMVPEIPPTIRGQRRSGPLACLPQAAVAAGNLPGLCIRQPPHPPLENCSLLGDQRCGIHLQWWPNAAERACCAPPEVTLGTAPT